MSHRRPGYILSYLVFVLAALSVVILAGAAFRASRLRSAREAYLEAAALALAQGGVEAAAAAIARRQSPPETPLGDQIELTDAVGTLEILSTRSAEGALEITSCARVTATRGTLRALHRCVEATIVDDDPPRITGWRER